MQQQYQCPSCGAPVAFGARFCGACGALLAVGTKEERRGTNPWLIVLVIFIAVVFVACGLLLALEKGETQPTPTPGATPTPTPIEPTDTPTGTSSLSSNLLIYLDKDYTKPWDSANMPDLNNLVWSASPSQAGWETSTLTVFLKNTGNVPIKVNATGYESLSAVPAGFAVSSDTIVIKPNEYSSLAITIDVSPAVRSILYPNQNIVRIYFHIYVAN
jgi:predicted nucleic acid-binding Zn ribbon protein